MQKSWCQKRAKAIREKNKPVSKEAREELSAETSRMECEDCRAERQKRILVAKSASDSRFSEAKFERAPAVFPSNDIKYEVNKLRAQAYATRRGVGLTYCPAKDRPSTIRFANAQICRGRRWLGLIDMIVRAETYMASCH